MVDQVEEYHAGFKVKGNEERLEELEERFSCLVENVTDGVLIVQDKIIKYANKRVMEMSGYDLEELIGMPVYNLVSSDSVPELEERFSRRENNQPVPHVFYTQMLCKDKSLKQIETSGSISKYDGKPALIAAGRDITLRRQAEEKLQQTLERLKKAVATTIQVLVSALESRDPYTAGHQSRVANLACAIAMEMGLDKDKTEGIRMAAIIHDIGKLSIPSEILAKPSKLTDPEFSLIKEHAHSGYEMLKNVESPWPLAEIVFQHHERMNGTGYPRKLKGDAILIEARILAVSDVVEAIASHRPYRPSLGIEVSLDEIERNRGILYDAQVTEACLTLFRDKGYRL